MQQQKMQQRGLLHIYKLYIIILMSIHRLELQHHNDNRLYCSVF